MAIKTRIIFVRHAEAEGKSQQGVPRLDRFIHYRKGTSQAQRVAQRLKDVDIDVIYSSSLKRTLQTAQYIADVKNLP